MATGINYTVGQRLQALTLVENSFDQKDAARISGIGTIKTIQRLRQKARLRGFDPLQSSVLDVSYVDDSPRSSRPLIADEAKTQQIIEAATKDKNAREKPASRTAHETGVSQSTVHRVMKRNGYRPCKSTKKPGLTPEMKKARYQFALKYKDWGLEEVKNVIFSDESSVLIGQRRGKIRVWRKPVEMYHPDCQRQRWKGFSEFMFWGCFSYDRKGPCYIWNAETPKEKKIAEQHIAKLNEALEPIKREEWDLNHRMARLALRNKRGKKPEWKWNKANGKITRESGRGGTDIRA